jgi:hypothetical protein
MSLEQIVRPAQTPDVAPAKSARVNRTTANWQPVVHQWGIGGTVKMVSGSYSLSLNLYNVKRPREQAAPGSFLGITFP